MRICYKYLINFPKCLEINNILYVSTFYSHFYLLEVIDLIFFNACFNSEMNNFKTESSKTHNYRLGKEYK